MTEPDPWAGLEGLRGEVRRNEPLAGHTSLKVGGPADLFVVPADREDLETLLDLLCRRGIPWLVMGGGYNLLVRDGGFRGAAISLERLNALALEPEKYGGGRLLMVEAGVTNRALVEFCRRHELSGLEYLGEIPGTIGGAIAVNAGAHGQSTLERVESLTSWHDGASREWAAEERVYGYRRHMLAPDEVILSARLILAPGDRQGIERLLESYRTHRRESQKVGFPNAGSFFKNPEDFQAWRLIDQAGLRGLRVGGAQVSEAHCNFLVNRGGATAADFLELAALVKDEVLRQSGIELEEEVRIVGEA